MPSTAFLASSFAYGAAAIKHGGDPDFNRIGKDVKDGYNPWAHKGHGHLAKPTEKPWVELSEACTCKNWKQVYAEKLRCGATLEYFSANRRAPENMTEVEALDPQLREKFCKGIYEKQDNNVCLNVNVGDDLGQWCFVSDTCPDVAESELDPENRHGGEVVSMVNGTGLAWKYCRDHVDKRWRTKSPEEIGVIAQLLEMDLGTIAKMSYPLYKFGLWKQVMGMWNVNMEENRLKKHGWVVEGNLHEDMEQIIASKEYTLFNTNEDGSPPYVITQGKHVWMVSLDNELNEQLRAAAGLKVFPFQ